MDEYEDFYTIEYEGCEPIGLCYEECEEVTAETLYYQFKLVKELEPDQVDKINAYKIVLKDFGYNVERLLK